MTKHRAPINRTESATVIVTTPVAELADKVDVLLGMTRNDMWRIVDALRSTDNTGLHAGAHRLADHFRDALMERPLELVRDVG